MEVMWGVGGEDETEKVKYYFFSVKKIIQVIISYNYIHVFSLVI